MTLYLGYYRPSAAQWQRFAEAEDNGTVEEEQQAFTARVMAARESSFAGNIVASYSPISSSFELPALWLSKQIKRTHCGLSIITTTQCWNLLGHQLLQWGRPQHQPSQL